MSWGEALALFLMLGIWIVELYRLREDHNDRKAKDKRIKNIFVAALLLESGGSVELTSDAYGKAGDYDVIIGMLPYGGYSLRAEKSE